ncbi:hypothetical protein APHMUC_0877 [Anaplasma phagocytophilum str. ApMUC09]|uniref:Uncharacterized protein n=1 Tax=Anaplasma phagocytophilum str. ApMUC09 TaxID=1359152 RepID=A0A0F3NBK8_ANAPH|nr:hypothetical protein APHMUC_0877 [Anaplasma phagocytophilum str. ApMUC09]
MRGYCLSCDSIEISFELVINSGAVCLPDGNENTIEADVE